MSEDRLLTSIRRAAELIRRGIVTAREFINQAFDEFAHADGLYMDVIPPLWEAVPEIARGEFVSAIRAATRPDFVWRPFYIGIGPPPTDEELRLGTGRIRSWSLELVRFLDRVPEAPGHRPPSAGSDPAIPK